MYEQPQNYSGILSSLFCYPIIISMRMQIQIESFSDIIPYYAFEAYTIVLHVENSNQ